MPASGFSRCRYVKSPHAFFELFGIEHLSAGILGDTAEQRHIRFQLTVFLRVGNHIGHARYEQRGFTRRSPGIEREKMDTALRRIEPDFIAAGRSLLKNFFLQVAQKGLDIPPAAGPEIRRNEAYMEVRRNDEE